jgi:hypothetical protein
MFALMVIGYLVLFIGSLMFLIAAFRESILWGLACVFFAPASLLFLVTHWEQARTAFAIQILGFILAAVGIALSGGVPNAPAT